MTPATRVGGMARDDEELAALLADLERTLDELRTEVEANRDDTTSVPVRDEREPDRGERGSRGRGERDERGSRGERRSERTRRDRRGRDADRAPRREFDPPGVTDVLRFTEEYTLPTLIATLEATAEALRLVQRLLRLVTPGESRAPETDQGRSVDLGADAIQAVSDRAATELTDRLAALRTELEEANLPEDDESREVLTEARELTDEIERRVRESEGLADAARSNRTRSNTARSETTRSNTSRGATDGPVTIEVGDPASDDSADDGDDAQGDTASDAEGDTTEESAPDEPPEVDVEAELESIKRDLGVDEDEDDEE